MNRVEFLKVWEDIILPHFGHEKELADYDQIRAIVRNYAAFKVQVYQLEGWNQKTSF